MQPGGNLDGSEIALVSLAEPGLALAALLAAAGLAVVSHGSATKKMPPCVSEAHDGDTSSGAWILCGRWRLENHASLGRHDIRVTRVTRRIIGARPETPSATSTGSCWRRIGGSLRIMGKSGGEGKEFAIQTLK